MADAIDRVEQECKTLVSWTSYYLFGKLTNSQACKIQECLARNDYQEPKCEAVVAVGNMHI
jgi:hypothetical protein